MSDFHGFATCPACGYEGATYNISRAGTTKIMCPLCLYEEEKNWPKAYIIKVTKLIAKELNKYKLFEILSDDMHKSYADFENSRWPIILKNKNLSVRDYKTGLIPYLI